MISLINSGRVLAKAGLSSITVRRILDIQYTCCCMARPVMPGLLGFVRAGSLQKRAQL